MKRRWILGLLLLAFVWVVITRFNEIQKLASTLSQGKWEWVIVAVLVILVYFVVFTGSYQAAFATMEVKSRFRDLLPVLLGSLFVNVVVPAGGTAGAALFVDDARRHHQSPSLTAAGLLLQLIADYLAFTIILVSGMVYLFVQHDLKTYEVITAIILLLLTSGLSAILLMGLWSPVLLRSMMERLQMMVNKLATLLKRPAFLPDDWAGQNVKDFITAADAVIQHPLRLLQTLLLALAAHLLDIVCLYVLFLAFHEQIKIGPLIAGYAMGILFWIISITPQGIGIVEGVMALVYTSLGVPPAVATTVALAFRGLTFWIPLLIGFILLRGVKSFRTEDRSLAESWTVRIIALLAATMGVINVLSAVTPSLMDRLRILEVYSPLFVRSGGHLTAALAGFALLLLAGGLWRRKRSAWWLSLGVLAISVISHLVKGLDYEEASLAFGLAILLVLQRHHFHARSDQPSMRQGIQVLLAALIFTLLYGALGFFLLDRHFKVNYGFFDALRQTVVMFTQFYDPGLEPLTRFGRFFGDSIYLVGALTIAYAILMLLRPVIVREPARENERQTAKKIVESYGRSSLARMALFDDKAYFFSPGGSVVAYALRERVGLALGDPIGPIEDGAGAIRAFIDHCQKNDWIPTFYQTLPEYLSDYQKSGLDILCIGQEAIVNLADFNLEGKAYKHFRNAVNRLTRTGHTFAVHQPPIPSEILTELRNISDEWLTMMHGSEKRFSLGWFDDAYIRGCPIAVIRSEEGHIRAFTNLVSEYQLNELSIDLMRHRREIEPGTMDFLFTSLYDWARNQGYLTFNMGLSPMYGVGEDPSAPLPERTLHFVYENINQFYNFRGLHEFKDKFRPQWSPRYLAYPGAASLAAVGLAIVEADAGERGLVWGYLKRKRIAATAKLDA